MNDNDLSVLLKFGESLFVDTSAEIDGSQVTLEGRAPVWFLSPHCNSYPPLQPTAVMNLKGGTGFASFSSSAPHFDPQQGLQNFSQFSGGGITESSFAAMTTNNHSVAVSHTYSNTRIQRVMSGAPLRDYDIGSPAAAYLASPARAARTESVMSSTSAMAGATSYSAASGAPWSTTLALSSHTFFTPNNSSPQFQQLHAPRRTRAKGFCVSERPWAAPNASPLISFYDQEVPLFSGDASRVQDCRERVWGLLCMDGSKDQVLPNQQTLQWIMGVLSVDQLNHRTGEMPSQWAPITLKDIETGSRTSYQLPNRPRNGRTVFEQNLPASSSPSSGSGTHNRTSSNSYNSQAQNQRASQEATPTSPATMKEMPRFEESPTAHTKVAIGSHSTTLRPIQGSQALDRKGSSLGDSSSGEHFTEKIGRASTAPFLARAEIDGFHAHSSNTNFGKGSTDQANSISMSQQDLSQSNVLRQKTDEPENVRAAPPATPPPMFVQMEHGYVVSSSTAPVTRNSVPTPEELSRADGFESLVRTFCCRVNEMTRRASDYSQTTRGDTLAAAVVLFTRVMQAMALSVGKGFVTYFQTDPETYNNNSCNGDSNTFDLLPGAEYTWSVMEWVPEDLRTLRSHNFSLFCALEACLQIVKIQFDSVRPPGTQRSRSSAAAAAAAADPHNQLIASYRSHILSTLQYDIIAMAPQMFLEPLDWCTVATNIPSPTPMGPTNAMIGYSPQCGRTVFSILRAEAHTAVDLLLQHSASLSASQHTTWIAGASLIATVMRLFPSRFTPSVIEAYLHNLESRYGEHVARCINVAFTVLRHVYSRHQ